MKMMCGFVSGLYFFSVQVTINLIYIMNDKAPEPHYRIEGYPEGLVRTLQTHLLWTDTVSSVLL